MGASEQRPLAMKGASAPINGSLPFVHVKPTRDQLVTATNMALAEAASQLGWSTDRCLRAASVGEWPPCMTIDALASVIHLQDALADEYHAAVVES